MKASRARGRWAAFAVCAGLVVAAMAWVSSGMLRAETDRARAEAASRRDAAVRLALWRMDTAMAALVARESAATGFDDARVRARLRAAAPAPPAVATRPDDSVLRDVLRLDAVGAAVDRGAPALARVLADAQVESTDTEPFVNNLDRQQRVRSAGQNAYQAGQTMQVAVAAEEATAAPAGVLVPIWLPFDSPERRWLLFARRPDPGAVEGFVLDWGGTERSLLAEVSDLGVVADLVPVAESEVASDTTGTVLVSAPVRVVAAAAVPAADADAAALTPTRVGLAVAWGAVFAGLAAAALLLRATLADADRRARFASSVTHELRTPLTTFRLYSEMLADDMVRDPEQRRSYLATLKSESARLANLVENVLAYARVEEGRAPRRRERVAVADLVERVVPHLRRRADECGRTLLVRADADAAVVADPDAVGQVLSNLVDNACKYAASASDPTIELTVERVRGPGGADRVAFRVRDHGPGLAPENVAAAFTPFERGNRPPGDAVPGIGLGLALSRGLARDHGGDLVHERPADGPGAAFVLTLPAA